MGLECSGLAARTFTDVAFRFFRSPICCSTYHHRYHHHHHPPHPCHQRHSVSCRPAAYARQDETRTIFFNHLASHPGHVDDSPRTNNSVKSILLRTLPGRLYIYFYYSVSDTCRADASRHGADGRSTKLCFSFKASSAKSQSSSLSLARRHPNQHDHSPAHRVARPSTPSLNSRYSHMSWSGANEEIQQKGLSPQVIADEVEVEVSMDM